jgi:hypothetical protein
VALPLLLLLLTSAGICCCCCCWPRLQQLLRPAWDFLPLFEALLSGLERFAGFAAAAELPVAGRARNLSQYLPACLTEGAAALQLLEVRRGVGGVVAGDDVI